MSRVCEICGKRKLVGGSITRRGLAKKIGGIGTHVVKDVKRTFTPNLQTVKCIDENGTVSTKTVCVACIRANKVKKA